MDLLNKIPKKEEELAWRIIEDEAVVIAPEENVEEAESVYIFNKTATKVWDFIDGKNSVDNIIGKIMDLYDAENEKIKNGVVKIIKKMYKEKFIISE